MTCQDNCCAPKPAHKVHYETHLSRAKRLKKERELEEQEKKQADCTQYLVPAGAFVAGFVVLFLL